MTQLNAKNCARTARILFFTCLLTPSYSVTSFADSVSYDFAGLIDSIGTNPVGSATVGTAFSGSFFFDRDFVTSVTLLPPFFGVNNYLHSFASAGAGLTLDMNGISFRSNQIGGASINLRDDSVPGGDQPFTLNFVFTGFNVWITSPLDVPDNTVLPTSLPLEGMRLNVCVTGGFTCSHGAVTELTVTTPPPTIENVLAAVNRAVDNGQLVGAGPGASASGRLRAWRNMLNAVQLMIESGSVAGACAQLQDIYLRVDGVSPPPDFVMGPSAPVLAAMIQALRRQLGCL